MKKLVRIEHIRCSEFEGYTYLLAPEDITQEQFEKDVDTASNNYLKAKGDFEKLGEKPKWLNTSLENFPDNVTIKEAKELSAKADKERYDWDSAERKITRSFGWWMMDLGYICLGDADAEEGDIVETSVNWGHRHSQNIEYDLTKTDVELEKKEKKFVLGKSIKVKG